MNQRTKAEEKLKRAGLPDAAIAAGGQVGEASAETGEGNALRLPSDWNKDLPIITHLSCTKAKASYAEALAKDRDKLQIKLNKVTAQRDQLLAALKFCKGVLNARGGHTAAERDTATREATKAIAAAEGRAQ